MLRIRSISAVAALMAITGLAAADTTNAAWQNQVHSAARISASKAQTSAAEPADLEVAQSLYYARYLAKKAEAVVPVTGTITISPQDDWKYIVENHDGNGDIIFEDGVYIATDRVRPTAHYVRLKSKNLGGAKLIANWEFLYGRGAWFWDFDMEPYDKSLVWMKAQSSPIIELRNCMVDGSDSTANLFMSIQNTLFTISAVDRNSTITMGPNVIEGADFDSGSTLKVMGNTSSYKVRWLLQSTDKLFNGLVFDASDLIAGGLQIVGPGGGSRGLVFRRHSNATFQLTGNKIEGLYQGIIAEQGSQVHLEFTDFVSNVIAVEWHRGAELKYEPDSVTFTANGTDFNGYSTAISLARANPWPGFRAYGSNAAGYLGAVDPVTYATTAHEVGDCWNGSDTFTAPEAGLYAIRATALFRSTSENGSLYLEKNGSANVARAYAEGSKHTMVAQAFVRLDRGNTVSVKLAPSSGTPFYVAGAADQYHSFEVQKISE